MRGLRRAPTLAAIAVLLCCFLVSGCVSNASGGSTKEIETTTGTSPGDNDDDATSGGCVDTTGAITTKPYEEAGTTPRIAMIGFARATEMQFNLPIDVATNGGHLYVAEQVGKIWRIDEPSLATGALAFDIESLLTLSFDQGLLGFTFHPAFPQTPYVYVSYTTPSPDPAFAFVCVIERYETKDGGLTFDMTTAKRILSWDHIGVNHNNNSLLFGPDGYLYISSGDGLDPNDVSHQNAQQKSHLQGKILRIDVNTTTTDDSQPYLIPPSNPFVDEATTTDTRPEIYAYGLRNPWRFNFDSLTGRLWAGDVGQSSWEEIDEILPGGNYGWGNREGFECSATGVTCDGNYIDPLIVHGRTEAAAIVGGVFYHGTGIPALTDKYIYADAQSGWFWSLPTDIGVSNTPSPALPIPQRLDFGLPSVRPVTMRLDEVGEMLVVSYASAGYVLKVTPPDVVAQNTPANPCVQ